LAANFPSTVYPTAGGSKDHISFITNRKDFVFIVQYSSKANSAFLAVFDMFDIYVITS